MRSWLALLPLAACNHVDDVMLGAPTTIVKKIPSKPDLDILFVIDNSPSTADKQTVFARNFTTFAAALDAFPQGRPDIHLGVVSTTVGLGIAASFGPDCPATAPGDDGLLQNTPRVPGCAPPTGRFISDIENAEGSRTVNYTGTLDQTLSCIAQLGTSGCGFESPLEAMKRALDGSRPENAGFLREGAALAVIILTDEDDCSADPSLYALTNVGPGDFRGQPLLAYDCDEPISAVNPGTYTNCKVHHGGYLHDPASYVDFLATIKDPSQTAVALIAGDPDTQLATGALTAPFVQSLALLPSCTATIDGNFAIARPALRLAEFEQSFHDHGMFETVCQPDYSGALRQIGHTLFTMTSPCLEGDLALPLACTVTEQDAPIPACAMLDATTPAPDGARPCWWSSTDPATCATTTGTMLHVERASPPPLGTVVSAACVAR